MTAPAIKNELLSAHMRLRAAAERATREIGQDIRVMASHDHEDKIMEAHLYRGTWVNIFPGIKLMLIDDGDGYTRALCEGQGVMPKHYHTYYESLFVLEGEIIERTTGKKYEVCETAEHEPYEFHEPELHGLFMVRWKPPLPQLILSESYLKNPVYHIV
jgi:mannose-6-phosphate isomerase-like protein (cupin superfamily)